MSNGNCEGRVELLAKIMNEKRLQYAYEKMFTYLYYVKKTILALLNANFVVENKCSITMVLFLAKFFGKKMRGIL